jgi:hypothetical protein
MKDITKEEFALGTICIDILHDILINKDFNFEFKRKFNIIDKNVKWIFEMAYKDEPLEEFDEYKESVYNYAMNVINGKFYLKDEKRNQN